MKFLLKLPSKKEAEHVLKGESRWKKFKMTLDWWSPWSFRWVLAKGSREKLGLVMPSWFAFETVAQTTFKQIRDFCGGWIETKKETTLKDYLHRARIKVKGDGGVPKEIEMECDGFMYKIMLWCEIPATVNEKIDQR